MLTKSKNYFRLLALFLAPTRNEVKKLSHYIIVTL